MLKFMRTHAGSWIIKILLGLIIVVFVFWGVGRIETKKKTVVATVGGDFITIGEFDRRYDELLEYYARIFGQRLSSDLLRQMNIKEQVLDQLINSTLFLQEGQRIGVRVSEDELREAILQYPAFQREGSFDRALYIEALRRTGREPGDFEEMIHRELMIKRVGELIGDTAMILTQEDTKELYLLENEQINLDFIKVSLGASKGQVKVTQMELEGYYSEHKEEFRVPPRVKVVYLQFTPDAYLNEAEVSSQEIQEYYDMNMARYRSPKKVRIRHILIKVSPEAAPEEVAEAKKRAEKVLADARGGVDFAALARKYSEDPSASTGGDLGYFSRGQMEPLLERAVFSLGKGEISSLVKTRHGFHIIKVEDVQEEKVKTLEEVREEIVSNLRKEKAGDLAAMHAEDSAYKAKKRGGLRAYAEGEGLKLREVGPFAQGEPIPELGGKKKFSSIAFTLGKDEISSAFQDGEDSFILQVVHKVPPQIPPLEDVEEKVREAFISSVARDLARNRADSLLKTWREGQGLDELLKANGLKVEQTGYFKRSSTSVPRIGSAGSFVEEVASLTSEDPWPAEVAEVADAYFVVKLRGVKKASQTEYEKDRDTYRKRLYGLTKGELLLRWLTAMKQGVEIEVNQELLGLYR